MIAKLKGKIDELKPTELILDVNGVGYKLSIPFSTYEKIQGVEEISLFVYTLHKEDQFRLFGFNSEQEKHIFSTLLNISGIGPSMALSILSGISIDMLIEAVSTENISLLVKVPGIGKTKAEKLVFELKRKLKNIENLSDKKAMAPSIKNDAVDALASLGFDEFKSMKIADEILRENPEISLEVLIKKSLQTLSS